jgi:hypothetical protein
VQLVRNHPLLALACPSATQCTAVDDDQYEVTFNPQAASTGSYALLGTPAGTSITGVACPSVTQCTAVDGTGEAATFNPQSPGRITPVTVLPSAAVSVSCPTASSCTAVDATGTRATFDPLLPALALAAGATTSAVDGGQPLALACPSTSVCVALDATGHAVEFDPAGTGASAVPSVGAAGSLTGLSCPSAAECVAVDATGRAFLATGPIPSPPVAGSSPRITGTATEGGTLRDVHGAWSSAPTSYALQWLRCASRRPCTAIPGAYAPSYTLGPLDVGDTIRVIERGVNAGGSGTRRMSAATARVKGLARPPGLSRISLSGVGRRSPRLALTITAGRYAPAMRRLTLVLPPGLGLRRRAAAGVAVRIRGRAARFSRHVRGRTLVIDVRRAAHAVTLTLASPQLTAGPALVRDVRRHRKVKLALKVAVPAPGHGSLLAVDSLHPRS